MDKNPEINGIIETLSPIERRVLPAIKERVNADELAKESETDKTTVLRALEFLKNKNIVKIDIKETKLVDLDINGILYLKKQLPERKLLNYLEEKKTLSFADLNKLGLNENESKISIGILKKKALINISSEGKILLNAKKEEITKKMLEEQLLEILPIEVEKLKPEQMFALKNLEARKNIIRVDSIKEISCELTELGKKIAKSDLDKNLIEQIDTKLIQSESWKGKKFRKYDLVSPVPRIYGGKRHFVNQATEYAKKIWLEMGFKEMTGNMAITSFWNFDALYCSRSSCKRNARHILYKGH